MHITSRNEQQLHPGFSLKMGEVVERHQNNFQNFSSKELAYTCFIAFPCQSSRDKYSLFTVLVSSL